MKGFSACLRFLVVSLFVVNGVYVYGAQKENIALEAKVEVSSTFNATFVGEKAIDGDHTDRNSRWVSGKAGAPGKESDPPHELILDFGRPMKIVGVNLYFFENWGSVEYVIQYDVGGKWVDIPDTKVENGKRNEITKEFRIFPSVGTHRLRFHCTDGCSYEADWGNIVRLYEIEVYSTGPAAKVAVRSAGKLPTTWGNLRSIS